MYSVKGDIGIGICGTVGGLKFIAEVLLLKSTAGQYTQLRSIHSTCIHELVDIWSDLRIGKSRLWNYC
jgi:hypothetical protein